MIKSKLFETLTELLNVHERPYAFSCDGGEYMMLLPCYGEDIKLLSVGELLIVQNNDTDSVMKFDSILRVGEALTEYETTLRITIFGVRVTIAMEIPLARK